jgi:hypothetical protein
MIDYLVKKVFTMRIYRRRIQYKSKENEETMRIIGVGVDDP